MARDTDPIADINERGPIIPHEEVGGGDCCGCLVVRRRGDQTEIVCNECATVIRTVTLAQLETAMQELAQTDIICSARCPHCGAIKIFPGFKSIEAFICDECGEGVAVNSPVQ